jgi:hypothetical protein
LVFGSIGTAAVTGNSSVFGDANRNILIKMAFGAEYTEPVSYILIRE